MSLILFLELYERENKMTRDQIIILHLQVAAFPQYEKYISYKCNTYVLFRANLYNNNTLSPILRDLTFKLSTN